MASGIKRRLVTLLATVSAPVVSLPGQPAAPAHDLTTRLVLPAPPQPFAGTIGTTFADSTPSFQRPVQAPAGAPNILVVLTDDVGFAASSTFGGPVPTPNLDRLAASGLRYNRFHTTAMCSPTRAALLTGRNHHAVGSGIVTDTSSGYPGYSGIIPRSAATIAEVLRLNGYDTAMFGKHHNVPPGRDDPTTGPFDQWPTGLGFEYFYGFIGGDTNQWHPKLYRGTNAVEPPAEPNVLLDHFLAEDFIRWMHNQKAAAPDKPFLAYIAPGSAHAPHQAPPEWISRFKGMFDEGWDKLRQDSLARQKRMGVVPADTALTPRPAGIPAWASLDLEERRISAHMMEVFAAMLAYQDEQIGLILDELDRTGQRQNTLVMFVEGDNGGSPEGDVEGSTNELGALANGMIESRADRLAALSDMGGPNSYEVYPVGWAWATNAPFQWTKQVGSHFGGMRNGLVVSWPARIKQPGGMRNQFGHVVDIAPTILEAAGLPTPTTVDGVPQQRMDGTSLLYSFNDARAPERHTRQYFELIGNRALYDHGWIASTTPGRLPWKSGGSGGLPTDYKWELYDTTRDFSQAHDLAAEEPRRLAAMQEMWLEEARANNVFPLDDRQGTARAMNALPRKPAATAYVYWGGDVSIAQSKAPPLNLRSFTIDAEVTVPADGAKGVLIASGSRFGGWSFMFEDGVPVVVEAASQKKDDTFRVAATEPLPAGPVKLSYAYTMDGRPGAGGTLTIAVNGRQIATGRIGRTGYVAAGLGETFDTGRDTGATVVDLLGGTRFNGTIAKIVFVPIDRDR